MKRILHVTGTMNRAGAETMLMNIYREIDRKKYQFDFVVFTSVKSDFEDEIKSLGGKIYVINEKNAIKRFLKLRKLLSDHKEYQVVHCHTNFSNAFHLLSARLAKVKKRIAHSHNTTDKSRNVFVSFFYHKIAKAFINGLSTHYVSCGKEASKLLFYKNKSVLVIPNSVDVYKLADYGESSKNYINNLFNLTNEQLKIIQVGRLQPEKNHLFSIEIAKELRESNVDFRMFFLGVGLLESKLKEKVKEYGLEKIVSFLGIREDVPQFMGGADIMLLPSFYEGFPVVLVESQAVGVPSLISNMISSEVDLGSKTIHFEEIKDSYIWSEKIKEIVALPETDKKERIESIVEKGFDIKTNAKSLIEFYNLN
ncbi:hypothetical protein WH52_09040 [Tenacibaculum holothuriorum]|uniref:Uncharacterized protein n=1 Tax=Tenacibaculum holothuriorum TaxID=1635173 RepID=A0A1Y2PDS4_9FLAO|nr:glycosyltransferase [Tenacibaculum holothuriorum]OSY88151.1 hypothetical protein WH52_09040 [Tenacibaculum holothuriorum]